MFLKLRKILSFLVVLAVLVTCSKVEKTDDSPKVTLTRHSEKDALFSRYLPLEPGNTWTYIKKVNGSVLFWTYWQKNNSTELISLAGVQEDIQPGTYEETYIVGEKSTVKGFENYFEIIRNNGGDKVNNYRDGRYNGFGVVFDPQKILWGRSISSEKIIEMDEIQVSHDPFDDIDKTNTRILFAEPVDFNNSISLHTNSDCQVNIPSGGTQVTVPAGTFNDCIEAVTKFNDATTFSFYAADVGLVKEYQKNGKGEVTYSLELKSYSH